MKLLEILAKANINYFTNLPDVEVRGITSRSNEVENDFVFVCLKGTKTDGHNYIQEAFNRGACAVVIENPNYACDQAIVVESSRCALANMLNVFNGEPTRKIKFVGITGTNGKTSVSVMIKKIFEEYGLHCELIGTLNCSSFSEKCQESQIHFTTPDPEELYPMLRRMSDAGVEYVIMETSSHALKLKKLNPICFEMGIFTNLTEDHLDFHLTMEDYFKSKLELFNRCQLGIINIDDKYGEQISKIAPCKARTCSMSKTADYVVKSILTMNKNGSRYLISNRNEKFEINIKVPGEFSILNSVLSCACARELDIDKKIIQKSFENFCGVKGRLERVELFEKVGVSVFIDYAHTPDALSKLLDATRSFKQESGKIILVFGCGGDREKEKRAKMGEIAVKNSSLAIIANDNPRSENPNSIIKDILSGIGDFQNYVVIPDRKTAIEFAIASASKNDVVLLAGKGHENYEINAHGTFPFDEREILCQIAKNYKEE